MRKKLNHWERMEAVIRWANMTTNHFALHIGLRRGENLYQIKRGNNGISLDVANHVVKTFPQINKLWLLTGDGEMFVDRELQKRSIPFYRADAERDIRLLENRDPDDYFLMPAIGPCDLALYYYGQAMGTVTPAGSIVFLQQTDPEAIIPGGEYVIVSKKIVTLRIVRSSGRSGSWRLVAGDSENFDDIVLEKTEIEDAYKVKVKLITTH